MDSAPRLYGYFRSSAAYRVRIALNLKGIASEQSSIHLAKGDQSSSAYSTLHPLQLVPLLADGDNQLTQSLAIIEYLDETHPQPPLLPSSPVDRAWVRPLALAIACDIHPLNNLRVLKYLKHDLGQSQDLVDHWYAHWIALGFAALETMLAKDPRVGKFCCGTQPTLADICLVPQFANAERFKCPVDAYPTIRRIVDVCRTLTPFQAAEPSRQPDAE